MTFVFECRECRICGIYNRRICYAYKYTDAIDATIDDVKSPGSFCPYYEGKPKWKPLKNEVSEQDSDAAQIEMRIYPDK